MGEPAAGELVRRFDRMRFGSIERTDTGYLAPDAIITRVGVFKYRQPDGSIRAEFRAPAEVFNADSLASARMLPVTNNHPVVDGKVVFVKPENAKALSIGSTGESPRQDGDNLLATVKINTADGIAAIQSGRRQLSCGYKCLVVKADGEYNGEHYTHAQRGIVYNHLALVDQGRAGAQASLRLDASDACMVEDTKEPGKEPAMPENLTEVRLDSGRSYQCAPEVADELTAVRERAGLAATKADEAIAAKDKLEGERDELKAKLDKAEKIDHSAAIAQGVKDRIAVLSAAKSVLDEKAAEKLDEMSDDEIRKAVIAKKHDGIDLAEKSEEYIRARFDAIVEAIPADKLADQGEKLTGDKSKPRTDGKKSAEEIRADALKVAEEESRKPIE